MKRAPSPSTRYPSLLLDFIDCNVCNKVMMFRTVLFVPYAVRLIPVQRFPLLNSLQRFHPQHRCFHIKNANSRFVNEDQVLVTDMKGPKPFLSPNIEMCFN